MADVIPIGSRRRASLPRRLPNGKSPVRHPWGVAGLVAAGLVFVAAVAITAGDPGANIRDLPAGARDALYRRSLEDVKTACTLPAAHQGALRQHCLRQAQFLTLFPECDAACQRTAASILPHGHR